MSSPGLRRNKSVSVELDELLGVEGTHVPNANEVSLSQLSHYAVTLAGLHRVTAKAGKPLLIKRLDDNVKVLNQAYEIISEAIMTNRRITSTDEWLVDNYWMINEQIHMAKKHLPPGFAKEMPKLQNTEVAGLPRIYGLVLELISLVNGQISEENIYQFVKAYQSVVPLAIGELWGIPIMLRLGLLENIRRVADEIINRRKDCNLADMWADKLLVAADKSSKNVVEILFAMSQSDPKISNSFVLQISQRLQGSDPLLTVINTWLEQQLSTKGLDVDNICRTQRHANHVDQITIKNSIQSLRFINVFNWKDFVENLSYTEAILRKDPSGIYVLQDFDSRDSCRHSVERIAHRNKEKVNEQQVATAAIKLANQAQKDLFKLQKEKSVDSYQLALLERQCHVGYWLLDIDGLQTLHETEQYKQSLTTKIAKTALPSFLTSIVGLTAIYVLVVLGLFWSNLGSALSENLLFTALVVPALALVGSQLAVSLTNMIVVHVVKPSLMPKMDFREGIPDEHRTLVVVPTMLTSVDGVKELIGDLQRRYLVNRDKNIYFGLITDFTDAKTQTTEKDDLLITTAVKGVENLNEMYPNTDGLAPTFYLFHRPREFNKVEGVWMGWERKRGKLTVFNNLLRGGSKDPFSHIVGDISILPSVKYVITLDTDTLLPSDAARRLIETAAHPLNKPMLNPKSGIVTKGYGLLQPRVSVGLTGAHKSLFAWMNSLDSGLDPYTKEVSDVYQDAFGEGSFIGKGLYHAEIFEKVMCDKFPENRILSHDLIEGCYVRSGLVSDVELIEEYPASYSTDVSRKHRWVRGDWQIASWLFPLVPSQTGYVRNPLTLLSKWKIFDNLRRSLVPLSMIAVLIFGWLKAPFGSKVPLISTLAVSSVWLVPMLLGVLEELIFKPEDVSVQVHLENVRFGVFRRAMEFATLISFLPHEAFNNVDAFVRVLFRMTITRKNLLEWTTSTSAAMQYTGQLQRMIRSMWFEVGLSGAIAAVLVQQFLTGKPIGGSVGLFLINFAIVWGLIATWLVSPILAWWLSKPIEIITEPDRSEDLNDDQKKFLRILSRKTWRFFETFVREEDNYLPLDNYQEFPKPMYARRTSPTNIGMGLLANIAAWDFGYSTASATVRRCGQTLASLAKMDRYKGHFYNWYDTANLKPLLPRYVSAVDSGNFVGHLILLRTALTQFIDSAIIPEQVFTGIKDNLHCITEIMERKLGPDDKRYYDEKEVQSLISSALKEIDAAPKELQNLSAWLSKLDATAKELVKIFATGVDNQRASDNEEDIPEDDLLVEDAAGTRETQMLEWSQCFEQHIALIKEELDTYVPFANLLPIPKELLVNESFKQLTSTLTTNISLRKISQLRNQWKVISSEVRSVKDGGAWLDKFESAILKASFVAEQEIAEIQRLAEEAHRFSDQDFTFMYNSTRNLISIGYNVEHNTLDNAYYDVFCSEARLCSFVGIAKGQFPVKHWFSMSRLLTSQQNKHALLSWSGSMFEYLMPVLVMPTIPGTLLDQTYYSVVKRQIEYGQQKRVPWGISESAFNMMDSTLVYQYGPFGVPGLGLKRGLSNDLVIAPYASAMALMILPVPSCENLQKLSSMGFWGNYGMIESIDFTPHRLRGDVTHQAIRSWFAHHSGMTLLSLAYTLLDKPMQKRFSETPEFQANELLLQEKIPKVPYVSNPNAKETSRWMNRKYKLPSPNRRFQGLQMYAAPEVHLLSNGRLHVMISVHGGGQIKFKELSVTRWREDVTLDGYGISCYLRDVTAKDKIWSTTSTPILAPPESNYSAMFSQAKAEFKRNENGILSETIVTVSPYDDVEVRRINLTNKTNSVRKIELTSYGELVLGHARVDAAHRAFSNLFVKTEVLPDYCAVLASRQPRGHEEKVIYAFQVLLLHEPKSADGPMSFETDRFKFIGRGYGMQYPAVLAGEPGPLSNSDGFPLDPIVAIRQQLQIQPGATVHADLVTGVAFTREEALKIITKYQKRRCTNRVVEYSWLFSEKLCFRLGITEIEAQLFAKLAGCLLYSSPYYRASLGLITKNRLNQSGLWRLGISGDLPILLVRIGDVQNIGLVAQCLQAHTYLRYKGLICDLVIWNDETVSYRDELHNAVMSLISGTSETSQMLQKMGGIFPIRGENLNESESILLYSVARVVLSDNGGRLVDQINRQYRKEHNVPQLHFENKEELRAVTESPALTLEGRDLVLTNEIGGFDKKNNEYVMLINTNNPTPQPWCNILANEQFGSVISEKGSAYTWLDNAHEYRLTPWNNDFVIDGSGEAFYIRDENTGKFWSPQPQPVMGSTPYIVRHGMGYSVWEHAEQGIYTETSVFVPQNEPIKVILIKVRNDSGAKRNLSVSGFVEWTLGELRDRTSPNIVTDSELGANSNAIIARNAYHMDFGNYVGFFSVVGHKATVTGDRSEFIGFNRTLGKPAAMERSHLSGTVGAALDPCGAIMVPIEIEDGKSIEVAFVLGAHRSKDSAMDLIERIRSNLIIRQLYKSVKAFWRHTLSAIQVETPDPTVDVLANGWLLYQVLSSRIWGRSGFYQSSGAFGFRDQLQDSIAVCASMPNILRQQIITCCEHQYEKGDVCHWWHPISNRGVRTTFSDDYLWLPMAVAYYIETTNDKDILDADCKFVAGRELQVGEESHYDQVRISDVAASVYEHCKRSIRYGLKYGEHGLPLMGCGDWNDGMNLVGINGKGESVWLAFFLYYVLERFETIAEMKDDKKFIELIKEQREFLKQNIEEQAWDGNWYKRAFFDSGDPLGSKENTECQIDSLPQSWSIISGATQIDRSLEGLSNAYNRLVRKDLKLIQLFDPAFEKTHLNPGYIKGYAPGVRENGGQYTHAAIWMIWAYSKLRNVDRTWELFDLLNPISHTRTRKDLETYRLEPYVVAADVYTLKGHEGRGGWSWYTGSAGWAYRLIIEQLLGIYKSGEFLTFNPVPRADWKEWSVHYRHGKATYRIQFVRSSNSSNFAPSKVILDNEETPYADRVLLNDDGREHKVIVHIGN